MKKVDTYLLHAFHNAESERHTEGATRGFAATASQDIHFPMLVRVTDPQWNSEEIPDLKISSRMKDILACSGTIRSIEALEEDPDVLSIEASRRPTEPDLNTSVPLIKADNQHIQVYKEKGDSAIIAIIDSGVDVLHEAFLDNNQNTRILEIWDQTDDTGPAPTINGSPSYGTKHTQTNINDYIFKKNVPSNLGRDRLGHGTHVASIAAGRKGTKFPGGLAPEANIVVVITNLKVGQNNPFSIGYSTAHQDALVYLKEFAQKKGLPIVVNLSQGMNAGAHDGTSLLEASFDNFSDGARKPGFVIVKSAGNERGNSSHAKLTIPSNSQDELRWESKIPHRGPDTIELWFEACDDIEFRLINPTGHSTQWLNRTAHSHSGYFSNGNRYEMDYQRYHIDNGDSRVMINIYAADRTSVESGRWKLEIKSNQIISSGEIHAWLEREPGRPVNFVGHLSDETTISIPGTANTVISVGSILPAAPFQIAPYSSYGPTRDRREKPEISAPGDSILAAKCYTRQDVQAMSGTSMAAPHITGAIALLLSYCKKGGNAIPNAAQIKAAMTQMSQNYNGRHHPGMGFGVVDVQRLIDAFK